MRDAAAIAGPGQSAAALPVILLVMAAIIWFCSPEHAPKELDAISV